MFRTLLKMLALSTVHANTNVMDSPIIQGVTEPTTAPLTAIPSFVPDTTACDDSYENFCKELQPKISDEAYQPSMWGMENDSGFALFLAKLQDLTRPSVEKFKELMSAVQKEMLSKPALDDSMRAQWDAVNIALENIRKIAPKLETTV